MINTRELRLGNYISFEGKPHRVEGITAYGINIGIIEDKSLFYEDRRFEPILISPETLKESALNPKRGLIEGKEAWESKFLVGSKTVLIEKNFLHQDWQCLLQADNPVDILYKEGILKGAHPSLMLCSIKYIHRLQNLYHLLTGRELSINF